MRTLRYWLGLPLFNLIVVLFLCVLPLVFGRIFGEEMDSITICFFIFLCYGGLFVLPLLTGLYYPAGRAECLPLWTPIMVSFFMSFVMWVVVWFVISGVVFPALLIALPIASVFTLVEILGYSVGLFIATAIANTKRNRRAIK